MEVDYQDFMSIELAEGINIELNELSPKRNDLSTISPSSFENIADFDCNEKMSEIKIKHDVIK
jgi:hypothetical protein